MQYHDNELFFHCIKTISCTEVRILMVGETAHMYPNIVQSSRLTKTLKQVLFGYDVIVAFQSIINTFMEERNEREIKIREEKDFKFLRLYSLWFSNHPL